MNAQRTFLAVVVFTGWSAGALAQPAPKPLVRAAAQMVASLETAWNKGDAGAWSELYTPNAQFLNISGLLFVGRDEIKTRHAFIFSTHFKGTRLSMGIRSVVPLGPDHMLLSTVAEVRGFQAPPLGITPTEPGVMRSLFTFTLQRQPNKSWAIVYSQNTLIAPGAPTPPSSPRSTPR